MHYHFVSCLLIFFFCVCVCDFGLFWNIALPVITGHCWKLWYIIQFQKIEFGFQGTCHIGTFLRFLNTLIVLTHSSVSKYLFNRISIFLQLVIWFHNLSLFSGHRW